VDVAVLVKHQADVGLAPEEDVLRSSLHETRRLPDTGGLVIACGVILAKILAARIVEMGSGIASFPRAAKPARKEKSCPYPNSPKKEKRGQGELS
jgi:hypothetical protein